MTPTSHGAFCKSCANEVIDFTQMSDEDVKHYLLNSSNEKLCGRFKQQQIDRITINLPANIFSRRIAGWKKFMAIVLLAFSSTLIGCDVIYSGSIMNKSVVEQGKLTGETAYATTGIMLVTPEKTSIDSTSCNKETMGKLIPPPLEELTGTGFIIKADSVRNDATITGKIALDTMTEAKIDTTIIKNKNPAGTSDCGTEQFY